MPTGSSGVSTPYMGRTLRTPGHQEYRALTISHPSHLKSFGPKHSFGLDIQSL